MENGGANVSAFHLLDAISKTKIVEGMLATAFAGALAFLTNWLLQRARTVSAEVRSEHDPHRIPLRRLVRGVVLRRRGLAVRILRASDIQAAAFYRHLREDTPESTDAEIIWGTTVNKLDRLSQIAFVEPKPVESPTGPGGLVDQIRGHVTRNLSYGERTSVWIRGPAGAGKTTLLLQVFFALARAVEEEAVGLTWWRWLTRGRQRRRLPVAMLVQPRNVGQFSQQQLGSVPADEQWRRFVGQWLDNRNIDVGGRLKHIAADLRHAIEIGDVVLVLDGYDELHQMNLGPLARGLVNMSPRIVCAERSDATRSRPEDAWVIHLEGRWAQADFEEYVRRRWAASPPVWASAVVDHLLRTPNQWLRTPRYVVLLFSLFERAHPGRPDAAPSAAQLRELTRGQYELLDRVFSDVLERKDAPGRPLEKAVIGDRLAEVAADEAGIFVDEAHRDDLWERVESLTELVTPVRLSGGAGSQIRLLNPLLREFFLGWRVVKELQAGRLPASGMRWTAATLDTAAVLLMDRPDAGGAELVWQQLRAPGLRIDTSRPADPAATRLATLNLLDLALHMLAREHDRTAPAGHTPEVVDRALSSLDLEGADVSGVVFSRTDFRGSSLANASLKNATFRRCLFAGADLTGADALNASFEDCTFLLPGASPITLRVRGLLVTHASLTRSDVTPDDLIAGGADTDRSRYRGAFGRFFTSRQVWLLGDGLHRLDDAYRASIRRGIATFSERGAVYLIDLMAGGSHDGLAQAVKTMPNLHVLAVDRDVTQLEALHLPARQFRTWKVDIGGAEAVTPTALRLANFDLGAQLKEWGGGADRAHLVIAKKAVHELPRGLQPAFIRSCHDVLVPGGQFVLFADAPQSITSRHLETLEEIRRLADLTAGTEREGDPLEDLRRRVSTLSFGDTPADIALFANLWVLLKDWANDNLHELRHRYFSSRDEIVEWCREAGFVNPQEVVDLYRLTAPKFNEEGIRFVTEHLDRHPEAVTTDAALFADKLIGADRAGMALLTDFATEHLITASGTPTALGRALHAVRDIPDFSDVHPALAHVRLPPSVVFDFPARVLTFERR